MKRDAHEPDRNADAEEIQRLAEAPKGGPPISHAEKERARQEQQPTRETGLAGGLLFLSGALLFGGRYWWPALRSFRQPLDFFRIGIAVGLMSIALHSLVDFCLQIVASGFLCS